MTCNPALGGFVPVRSSRRTLRAIVAFALLAAVFLALPSTALAVSTGSGGWYWPVGTEDFRGWGGWWDYRAGSHAWHMAQDMPSPLGHAVYAVGDGVVLESKQTAGYPGVIVILHRTLEGDEFKAVYGHINRKVAKGVRVSAGQVIGTVNGQAHVHFGIHPGRAYPPDRNPFRGHTYDRKQTYGWVDPVKFLRANPRAMAYKAPTLPRVTTVTATATPTFLGVAGRSVYFSVCPSAEATATYRRALAGGACSMIATSEALPSLDATRFAAA
jgi:murein DD-endopeptidase MepM/ murein hydrolase activator NlpD